MKTTPLHDTHCKLNATFTERSDGWTLPLHYSDPISEHLAVRNDVGFTDISYLGILELTGDDRASFLHRLVSNDVENLSVGEGNYATLLTHRGKIIADFNIYTIEDSIYVITAPQVLDSLFIELDKYIIADDVELKKSTDLGIIAVAGPNASELVGSILDTNIQESLAELSSVSIEFNNDGVLCIRSSFYGGIGFQLITSIANLEELWKSLSLCRSDVTPFGYQAQESLRIEAGTPLYSRELTDSVIPLEAELDHAIDFEKGCYIGQEIVARMKYRGHPNRLLRGIEIQSDETVPINTKIYDGDKEIGWVTSSTYSPSLDKQIALGYVRMAYTDAGCAIKLETPEYQAVGSIVELPFLY
ncbi:aminomethyltransferase family protein [Candidatus Poribacteria bacterium]|nr:aminomethyltransferase family protein [Candidatus Poribacteria bacterium]